MKKAITFILFYCFLVCSSKSQVLNATVLDTNNMRADILSNGYLFHNINAGSGLEIPKGSGKYCMYSSHIWLGGIRPGTGIIHLAAEIPSGNGTQDFWAGPVANNYNTGYDATYDRFWTITRDDIQNHLNGIATSNAILDWPAHGNTANGEAANLAPYVDVNNNNMYDPMNGDYPMFKGDKATFFIINDDRDSNTTTNSHRISVEVHIMVYQYAETNFLKNTTFVSYNIFNRSTDDYSDFYVGHFDDFDIGNYNDDYVGCSVSRYTYFGYNGDSFDEDNFGTLGYDSLPPALGVTFLNQDLRSFKYFNNSSSYTATNSPNNSAQYYNYLRGLWLDATPMVVGGVGHPLDPNATSVPSFHMFSGNVFDTSQWSEVSAANLPGDRRGLGTTNSTYFASGDSICLDLAYTYYRSDSSSLMSVLGLLNTVDSVQDFYDNENFICHQAPIISTDSSWVGITDIETGSTFTVYPNPFSDLLIIESDDLLTSVPIKLLDAAGRIVWQGLLAPYTPTKIETGNHSNGIYYLKIGNSISKIIKM